MHARSAALALLLVVPVAGCSSSGSSATATSKSPSTTEVVTTTTAPPGTTMHWQLESRPGFLNKQCDPSQQCVLLATENGTVTGDLTGTSFTGSSAAFSKNGHFASGRTDLFRGTVKGCGSGTLVFVVAELADVHGGTGEWRIQEGFGTGDLAGVTGHGTGTGTVDGAGFHSQWEGVIDCGK